MAWKVDGKIGYLATGQTEGNPQQDTYRILYQAPGQNTQEEIEKVFYLPPGGNPNTDLLLVWHRYMARILLAGSQNVAIEYIPTEDITVDHLTIFTNETSTGNSPRIKIFHESGLCIAATDGDAQGSNEQKYGLTGCKHTSVINNATLFAGQVYYIVYSHGYGGTAFYPAYFQNELGDYKVYENETGASSMTLYDISETSVDGLKKSKYKGLLTNSNDIWNLAEDDWFTWVGSTETGMNVGHVYVRSDVGDSEHYTYTGIIGDPNNTHTITTEDLQAILDKPYIPNKPAEFIWYVDQVTGMTRGEVWAKTTNTSNYDTVDLSSYSDEYIKSARLLYELNTKTSVMCLNGSIFWNNYTGDIFSLPSGYTSKVTSMTPLSSIPSNVQNGEIYFLAKGTVPGEYSWTDCCYIRENDSWTAIAASTFTSSFTITKLYQILTKVGTNSQIMKRDISTGLQDFFTNTLYTDKKFYLEINGNEV